MGANLKPFNDYSKQQIGGVDKSSLILKEIFGTKDDFTVGQMKTITPGIAQELLEHNSQNRNLRKVQVQWLAKQMELGYWIFSGDTVKMTRGGFLADKQHTLHAIIESGKSQDFIVVGGLSDDVINVVDTGLKRSPGDVLLLNGIPNANNLAAIIARVLAFKNNRSVQSFVNGGLSGNKRVQKGGNKDLPEKEEIITNMRILELAQSDEMFVEAAKASTKFYTSYRGLTQSQYGMLYYLFAEKHPDKAWEFFSKFSSMVDLKEGSPILAVRRRIEKEKESLRSKTPAIIQLNWFIYCWNKFRTGQEVRTIRDITIKDELPAII